MRAYDENRIATYTCDRCGNKIEKDKVWRMRTHNISFNNTSKDHDLCETCILVLKNALTNLGRVPVL